MGVIYKKKCNDCGATFEASVGGGMDFYLLRCDTCGNNKRVMIAEVTKKMLSGEVVADTLNERIEIVAGPCAVCEGAYKVDAPVRCPKCRSTNHSECVDNEQVTRGHYD